MILGFYKTNIAQYIFEKFSRNRNTNNSGSGLGLSIVKGFTEALGGTIEFQALDPGSRFIVSIPVKTTYVNDAGL